MQRVLITFYDPEPIRNVLSLLHAEYNRIYIFYCPSMEAPSRPKRERLSDFMQKNFKLKPSFVRVSSNTIEEFTEKFRGLLRDGNLYEFDIAGDSSAYVAAVGAFMHERPQGDISLIRFSPRTDKMQIRYPGTVEERERRFEVSVPDMIALQGTFLTKGEKDGMLTDTEQHNRELKLLWEVVRKNPVGWNKFCMLRAVLSEDQYWRRRLITVEDRKLALQFMPRLAQAGLVSDVQFNVENGREELEFVPSMLPESIPLLQKAGLTLERYSYFCAVHSGLFSDVRTGIEIDWDGLPSTGADNPYNEIDLVFTFGNLIGFCSCKNREPNKDDLYEISVLTRHFGGKYAAAILLCTLPASSPVATRAKEMGVFMIDNVKARDEKSMMHRFAEIVSKCRNA